MYLRAMENNTQNQRVCSKCLVSKPESEFYLKKDRNGFIRDKLMCKQCVNSRQKEGRDRDPEAYRAFSRNQYQKHKESKCAGEKARRDGPQKEQILAQKREYHNSHKLQISERRKTKIKAMTPDEYRAYKLKKIRSVTDSPIGWAGQKWRLLNQRTVNGNNPTNNRSAVAYRNRGVELRMTRPEFYTWVEIMWPLIKDMYNVIEKNADKLTLKQKMLLLPSVDRIDGKGHYSLDNIQIVTVAANLRKSGLESKNLTHNH